MPDPGTPPELLPSGDASGREPVDPVREGSTSADVGAALQEQPPADDVQKDQDGNPVSAPAHDSAQADALRTEQARVQPQPLTGQAPAGETLEQEEVDFSNRSHRQVLRNILHDGEEFAPGSVIDVGDWDKAVVEQLVAEGALAPAPAE